MKTAETDPQPAVILVVEDDPDDRFFIQEAFREAGFNTGLKFVEDGEEMLDYLLHRGAFSHPISAPRPSIILLDLNMPRLGGRIAYAEIQEHPKLRRIPVIILTISKSEEDILHMYDLGVKGYIIKPVRQKDLVEVIQSILNYWFRTVVLPPF